MERKTGEGSIDSPETQPSSELQPPTYLQQIREDIVNRVKKFPFDVKLGWSTMAIGIVVGTATAITAENILGASEQVALLAALATMIPTFVICESYFRHRFRVNK